MPLGYLALVCFWPRVWRKTTLASEKKPTSSMCCEMEVRFGVFRRTGQFQARFLGKGIGNGSYLLFFHRASSNRTDVGTSLLPGRTENESSNCIQEANNVWESPPESVLMAHFGKTAGILISTDSSKTILQGLVRTGGPLEKGALCRVMLGPNSSRI